MYETMSSTKIDEQSQNYKVNNHRKVTESSEKKERERERNIQYLDLISFVAIESKFIRHDHASAFTADILGDSMNAHCTPPSSLYACI